MDVAEFNRQIRKAWQILSVELQLGRAFIWNTSLGISEDFRRAALDESNDYATIYRSGLSLSHYNIILKDYSYFQFSWENDASWRLAYFPNPWIAGVEAAQRQLSEWESLEASGEMSHEDVSMLMDEMAYFGSVPPLRFEFSTGQYRELAHPAAHFHIGRHTGNRWPAAIRLGPAVFSMLVGKMYYSNAWAAKSRYYDGPPIQSCLDDDLINEAANSLAVHEFTDAERRSPHFGRGIAAPPAAEHVPQGRRGRRPARGA